MRALRVGLFRTRALGLLSSGLSQRPTSSRGRPTGPALHRNSRRYTGGREYVMKWIVPDYCDIRLGFEVTAYAYVR